MFALLSLLLSKKLIIDMSIQISTVLSSSSYCC
ncbi:hypothetical protein GLYMA_13G220151v4 [Glycine max]|nr:hypothetical protein GLYMA_13G220151v4 [Glycine max]KAH1102751.1 hypothetical protein GYH30_037001 [Glycine max]